MHTTGEFALFRQRLGLAVTHMTGYSLWEDMSATSFRSSGSCGSVCHEFRNSDIVGILR